MLWDGLVRWEISWQFYHFLHSLLVSFSFHPFSSWRCYLCRTEVLWCFPWCHQVLWKRIKEGFKMPAHIFNYIWILMLLRNSRLWEIKLWYAWITNLSEIKTTLATLGHVESSKSPPALTCQGVMYSLLVYVTARHTSSWKPTGSTASTIKNNSLLIWDNKETRTQETRLWLLLWPVICLLREQGWLTCFDPVLFVTMLCLLGM